MIGYVTFGTNDLERAATFYDAVLAEMGATRMMEYEQFVAWSLGPDTPGISATKPYNGQPATPGNGTMVALAAQSPEQVQAVYNKAIEMGGTDEGGPGPRDDMPGFYAAYFRDMDGNKLNVFCFVES